MINKVKKRNHLHVVRDKEGNQSALFPQIETFQTLFEDLLTIYVKTGKHLHEDQEEWKNETPDNFNNS